MRRRASCGSRSCDFQALVLRLSSHHVAASRSGPSAAAIVDPDAGIAHGYVGVTLRTIDGLTLHGLPIKEGDPVMIRGIGGLTQTVPAARIESRERLTRSLMMSAEDLGMTSQDVADLIAFLRTR